MDEDPERLYNEPYLWVHFIEVPERHFGSMGQLLGTADIMKMITDSGKGHSPGAEGADYTAADPTPGTAIDPICGMTVPLTNTTLTVEQGGTVYAFCSSGCRDLFTELQHA
ncbi:MAG: YHS domain-containing protein [Nocardioidaceae bacterium]